LTGLLASRTTFIIAHRLSTVRRANLILVIDKGTCPRTILEEFAEYLIDITCERSLDADALGSIFIVVS
jgi:hypothetical protein